MCKTQTSSKGSSALPENLLIKVVPPPIDGDAPSPETILMQPRKGTRVGVVSSLIRVVRHLKITIFFLAILACRFFGWPGYLMERRHGFVFFVVGVVAAVAAWRSNNTSQLDRSVFGQPIGGPVTQEGCLGRPMGQTVPEELSGNGRHVDDWAGPPLIERALRWWKWPNTFRLARSKQRFGSVRPSRSWRGYLRPMKQKTDCTCAIMACTMAVEGMHRKVYETLHGSNTFPDAWMAAEGWTDHLLSVCKRQDINDDDVLVACKTKKKKKKIWTEDEGSIVGYVLAKIKELRGVRTAGGDGQQLVMPLDKWEKHSGDEITTIKRVAELLDQGPCVGRLWACPWYRRFNAAKNDGGVYRGCGRDKDSREESRKLYGKAMNGSHAVVCFAYRLCENGEMHVHVLDNHTDDGPERWVDVQELDALYTLKVDCLCGAAQHHHDAAGASATSTHENVLVSRL